MVLIMAKRKLIKLKKQTGTRKSVKADRRIKARPPGIKIAKNGRKYTETRKNRTDKRGKRL